jgi:hypothetical protein
MKASDMIKLLSSPFRRRTLTRKPELPARMMDLGIEEPERGQAQSAKCEVRTPKLATGSE